jgi:hypothetical protein
MVSEEGYVMCHDNKRALFLLNFKIFLTQLSWGWKWVVD